MTVIQLLPVKRHPPGFLSVMPAIYPCRIVYVSGASRLVTGMENEDNAQTLRAPGG